MLRFLTAGESHGPALTVIVDGIPAGLQLSADAVNRDLIRRMGGYGRGGRMKIEKDRVLFEGGVRHGQTLGSPIACRIVNLDFANCTKTMAPQGEPDRQRVVTRPRPGHADLPGALKYGTHDARDILERASARETAARTVAGAIAKALLGALGIRITSRTASVGDVSDPENYETSSAFEALIDLPDDAPMRTIDSEVSLAMIAEVDRVRTVQDSIGGSFEVLATGAPVGLGSHTHWDRRLDGRLAGAIASIQAVKAVSLGEGLQSATRQGTAHHDPIEYDAAICRFTRPTNRAGGIEGGISNGEMIRVVGVLKPLASLSRPLASVDLVDKSPFPAQTERTDTIPIVAAGVVGEAMLVWILADECRRKFGGDSLREVRENFDAWQRALEAY